MDILNDKIVKTRKDHQCHGCLKTIKSGSNVWSQTVADSGECYTTYNHKICRSVLNAIYNNDPYGDGVEEGFMNCINDYEEIIYTKAEISQIKESLANEVSDNQRTDEVNSLDRKEQ